MTNVLKTIIKAYGLDPEKVSCESYGQGHIHDTYMLNDPQSADPPMILQKMNNYVFRDIGLLMRNIERVTYHIAANNQKEGRDPRKFGLMLRMTKDGRSYIDLAKDGYWRIFWFIENQVTHENAGNNKLAYEGGKTIARFQRLLTSLDPELIGDTIPRFHDLQFRLNQFNDALKNTSHERLEKAVSLIDLSKKYAGPVIELYNVSSNRDIPLRITHNDTKFNNILFDQNGRGTCMIDLDTVMKGYAWFDFGDALRTCASMVSEDEADLSKVGFREDVYNEFTAGFLTEAVTFLTPTEISILHLAPRAFTFMQGLRFLTDYLNNDVYYKILHESQNLERAANQYALMLDIIKRESQLEQTTHKIAEELKSCIR